MSELLEYRIKLKVKYPLKTRWEYLKWNGGTYNNLHEVRKALARAYEWSPTWASILDHRVERRTVFVNHDKWKVMDGWRQEKS